jgi:hypothetical protein
MTKASVQSLVFDSEQLLPDAWRHVAAAGPVRTFNPGLLREGDGWLFAYRVVASDGLRRIGLCRLNQQLEVVNGSVVALTDHVRFAPAANYPAIATQWFADPRIYRFGSRLFIYWNSGWHEPRNYQFLQELSASTLSPMGFPRELVLRGERQKLEKNWTMFAGDKGNLYAVYSIIPHRVLGFSLDGDGDIVFEDVATTPWMPADYPRSHGGLRGGAPPCFADGQFWSFCHSVHDAPDGYRYAAALYSFAPAKPFAPIAGPTQPLDLGGSRAGFRAFARLNPAVGQVIYPCGAARDGARWLISHGINDEYCAISFLEHADAVQTLRRVDTTT